MRRGPGLPSFYHEPLPVYLGGQLFQRLEGEGAVPDELGREVDVPVKLSATIAATVLRGKGIRAPEKPNVEALA